jgi:glutaredoxin
VVKVEVKTHLVKAAWLFALLVLSIGCYSEIYKWYDENGQLHFGDEKPEHLKAETVTIKPNVEGYKAAYNDIPDASANSVTMYMTDWCGYCKKAKKYFIQQGIPFTEKNIETDARAKKEHKALGGGGIPLIMLNGQKMRGFSAKRFDRFYQQATNTLN